MIAEEISEPAAPPSVNGAAYAFVRQLAVELSGDSLELPGYPKVALRVQKMLSEDNVSNDQLVRVLGAEASLSARILNLANSAAHNPSGQAATDLRSAVIRLGFDSLRTAVISFAMTQQREAAAFKTIHRQMRELWLHSVEVSAVCFVLARVGRRFNTDTALLMGVVSGVGKLYVLTRASAHAALFGDEAAYNEIVRDWHANIAQALLEHWHMSDEIVCAVRDYEGVDGETRRHANLADVLAAAHLIVAFKDAPDLLQANVSKSTSLARLGLDAASCDTLLTESAQEIAALKAALGE
jgi:HD-like signal output (HDOD) protein